MLFTIILVCSLYYLVCFYIGYKIFLEGEDDFGPIETMYFLVIIALVSVIVAPIIIIGEGWSSIHNY